MTSADLLLSCWESSNRQDGAWRALGLLQPATSGAGVESLAELSIGELDARLLDLRRRLFGRAVEAVVRCPDCGARVELTFDLAEIQGTHARAVPLTLSHDGWRLDFRLPSRCDLAAASGCETVEEAAATLLERCVVDACEGSTARTAAELPGSLVALMEERMAAAAPQADVCLAVRCHDCGVEWESGFDIASFLAAEVAAGAWRLLGEVRQLAVAFGWSEAEILSLSPQRRQAYLQLADEA
jgi:hypothetical protein